MSDAFSFDVTNGIQSLQGLEVTFDIVPKVIPLEASDLELEEGESIALSSGDYRALYGLCLQGKFLYFLTLRLER